MKCRADFVTNSSSSSFTIAFKPEEPPTNIAKFLYACYFDSHADSKEELESLYMEMLRYDTDDEDNLKFWDKEDKEQFETALKKIEDGSAIAILDVEYHSEMNSIIQAMHQDKLIEILGSRDE
jgi:hypothetical protein